MCEVLSTSSPGSLVKDSLSVTAEKELATSASSNRPASLASGVSHPAMQHQSRDAMLNGTGHHAVRPMHHLHAPPEGNARPGSARPASAGTALPLLSQRPSSAASLPSSMSRLAAPSGPSLQNLDNDSFSFSNAHGQSHQLTEGDTSETADTSIAHGNVVDECHVAISMYPASFPASQVYMHAAAAAGLYGQVHAISVHRDDAVPAQPVACIQYEEGAEAVKMEGQKLPSVCGGLPIVSTGPRPQSLPDALHDVPGEQGGIMIDLHDVTKGCQLRSICCPGCSRLLRLKVCFCWIHMPASPAEMSCLRA